MLILLRDQEAKSMPNMRDVREIIELFKHYFFYSKYNIMLGCSSSLFGLSSDLLKDTFLLYKRVTEQYRNLEILKIIRSLIPEDIVLQTKEDSNIVPLLKWFKDD